MKYRFSIRLMMLVVIMIALDFSILRGWLRTYFDPGIAYVMLPMANLLILLAPRAWAGAPGRAFWIGFEAAGWIMVGLFGELARSHGATFFGPVNSFYPWPWGRFRSRTEFLSYQFAVDFVVYMPPQVLVAWLGGRLSRWVGARIARRGASGA